MAYKYTFFFSLILLLCSAAQAQKTLDGSELRTSKKAITVSAQGKELPFQKSEVFRFRLHPHFHDHEGMYIMDTVVLMTRGWFRQHSGLESGLESMHLTGKNIDKLTRFLVSVGDPMSPSSNSDTIGIKITLSYKGGARFKKPFDLALHVDGSDAQSMAWGYMSSMIDLQALGDSCITETVPSEIGDFRSGFIQEIQLMNAMPARMRFNFSDATRSMCVEAFEKKGVKTHWEIKNIVLRFP